MIYVVAVLGVLLLLAGIVILAMGSGLSNQKKVNGELQAQLDAVAKKVLEVDAAHKLEIETREAVITNLKKEIGELEKDLAENRDPAVVRARLGKLLSNPA